MTSTKSLGWCCKPDVTYLAEDLMASTRRTELLSKQAQLKAFREEMDDLSQ